MGKGRLAIEHLVVITEERKPLNRALSFMNLDNIPDDEAIIPTPPVKKPRMADSIKTALETPMRVVPNQTVS